ncbi:hypothetical protein [Marinobacter bohaiensis]|uniref:hypothetical protein n=1 Tax=Marinobacter bohaiensis TaxID=2201898 RepID=UPI000DAEBA56|nr:hypothetical protein [Marinobacter bohaiensis]
MRANRPSRPEPVCFLKPARHRTVFRLVLPTLMAAVLLGGCRTEKSSDAPTIIGTPPATAYLGVEYAYNFGAYGGDRILDYSLTNAPAWLGLEDTSNKARQGIILRGVPGVTGGGRGEADLGAHDNINLTTTDGGRVGVEAFDIDVQENTVSIAAPDYTEGETGAAIEGAGEGEICAMPDMSGTGRHEVTYDLYNEDGSASGDTESRVLETRPVLVTVRLAEPSVLATRLVFELESDFDPADCDGGADGQACEFSTENLQLVQLGKDVVLAGNRNGSGTRERLPQPDYVEVIDDTSGVLTVPPGITECFIRLEVVDDPFPEPTEHFRLALTEVREGLVSLGSDGNGLGEALSISDNAPTVNFQSLKGHAASALNEGATGRFQAVLDRGDAPASQAYSVRLFNDPDVAEAGAADFEFRVPDPEAPETFVAGTELTFPANEDTAYFEVAAVDDSAAPPASEDPAGDGPDNGDEFLSVTVDASYQNGRAFYASAGTPLTLWLNELTSPLLVGDAAAGSVPSDLVVGDNGRVFVASSLHDDASGEYYATLDIYDRFGGSAPEQTLTVATGSTVAPEPRLAFAQRVIEAGSEKRIRRSLVMAFRTDGAVPGATSRGGLDQAVYLYRRDADEPGYTEVWHRQDGTAVDEKPLAIRLNTSDQIFLAGETTGAWPGQSRRGGVDVFVQRIDTVTNNGVEAPETAWTHQQGSGAADGLTGLGVDNLTTTLTGTTLGQIGNQTPLGGRDLFLSKVTGAGSDDATTSQVGTARGDTANAAEIDDAFAWLVGDGAFGYSQHIDESEYVAELVAGADARSGTGYVLTYELDGTFDSALTLNDGDDLSDERWSAATGFDGDLIIGGHSSGAFVEGSGGGLILARVGREEQVVIEENEDDPDSPIEHRFGRLLERGRDQYPSLGIGARLERLAVYENAEITALVSRNAGGRIYEVLLFNGDGEWLNPP